MSNGSNGSNEDYQGNPIRGSSPFAYDYQGSNAPSFVAKRNVHDDLLSNASG